jgi:hypothetical protein
MSGDLRRLEFKYSDVINEGPCRCGTSGESENIVSFRHNGCGEEFKVGEAGSNGVYDLAVPNNLDEGGSFLSRRTERTGLEEVNYVALAGDGGQGFGDGECAGESVYTCCRSEEGDGITVVREWLEEEDGGIESSSRGAGADPVGVFGVEAEVVALCEIFKSTVDDEVRACVATREGYLEVALTSVDGSRLVSDEEVHAARVSRGDSVDDGAPDVEVLACTTTAVSAASVALLGTSVYVISIEESKAHVSWSIIGAVCGAKDESVTLRISRINESLRRETAGILNKSKASWWRCELLSSEVELFSCTVGIGIESAFQI